MTKIVVTGGRGFIGNRVVERFRARGYEVVAPSGQEWRLGAPLPASCDEAVAVVHLASAVLKASRNRQHAVRLDVAGSKLLLEQHRALRRAGKRGRFIFVSSQSAQPHAGNDYGRSKWAIEELLTQDGEIAVRPGLVYDHAGGSVFGVFASLAKLPVVPILSSRPCIQPIDVLELAEALLRIVEADTPLRCYELGGVVPLTFAAMIRAVARRSERRSPWMIRFPAFPVRGLAAVLDTSLRLSPPLLERVDGLIALEAMDTSPSLQALDMELAPF